MTLIKICGITSLDDARAAIEAGADMLGFNFYRPSPRFIEPAEARKIIESLQSTTDAQPITTVGVFVNEVSPGSLMRIVEESGVTAVQLHGEESIEFCQRLKLLLNGKSLIKVLRVIGRFTPTETEGYDADAIMLDSFHSEMRGGTGHVFDWSIARSVRELVPLLFLAGGLSPTNVAQAIAQVKPYAVDACSSLESTPGQKDAARMRAFVQAVRNG
ncbi:MAG TPA: phosphoribosylanthranilate isomerase [Pyrinomonadaceae bacterium]|nr:phosphoribosylanthranilate isomerase [Pyrinomonadaceae bacterium]